MCVISCHSEGMAADYWHAVHMTVVHLVSSTLGLVMKHWRLTVRIKCLS